MLTRDRWKHLPLLPLVIGIMGIPLGLALGLLAGVEPTYIIVIFVALAVPIYFFSNFEQAVFGLLIVRSSLDVFSEQQLPSAFALGVDLLAFAYVVKLLLSRQKVQTDGFWWFFTGWVALQGLWVILLPLGGLGLGASFLSGSLREWIRLLSFAMAYLLVMQLKGRISPEKAISTLFLSLIAPLTAAALQVIFPPSMLPSFLVFESGYSIEAGSRMNGTLGHPSTFATFVLLFLALTFWKLGETNRRLPWIVLVGTLAFFLVSSQSLTGMMMLFAFIPAFIAPKLNIVNLIGGILLFGLVIVLFATSELGQERLQSLYGTPLLNPDIDISKAIFLHWRDGNSFNWRIAQWTFLLEDWQKYPIWGNGISTSSYLSPAGTLAHNDYVRFLAEQGIVGLTVFLALILAQFARLIQLLRSAMPGSPQRNLCLVMLAMLIAILVGMLTDNIWSHTTLYFYWWSLMAILGWDWTKPISENEEDLSPK
jgi:O-antigen ligase